MLDGQSERIEKTERDLLQRITNAHFDLGGTKFSFDPIVASGANSAIPHYKEYGSVIEQGPILIDFGVVHQGYCSDMTRTFWVGEKQGDLREQFQSDYTDVRNAYNAAIHHLVSGATIGKVATHIDIYFTGVGKRELFTHALGHGVGVEVHEQPGVYSRSEAIVEPGMCLAIEPGLYRTGQYGIRHENTVLIQDSSPNQEVGAIRLQDVQVP